MSIDNYKILYRIHLVLGMLVLLAFGFVLFAGGNDITPAGRKYLPIVTVVFPLIHFVVAAACFKKSEFGRLASKIIGFLMLPFLPIGTIVGLIIIQNCKKNTPQCVENA